MQEVFDNLYERSQNNSLKGFDLYRCIISEKNILLAYRTIKNNKGSNTSGVDETTIRDIKQLNKVELVSKIRFTLKDYHPNKVRRVDIPKDNGETRPLGIPTILDRIIQQMFKQVLEPVVEARFHKHSYGFRPNRSTQYALARCHHLINMNKLHYVIDVDIKGFFDNVNHNKLMKQLYTIGIKDSRVLCIIRKMLHAPIQGIGIPVKGTPQGGILSPLLANVTLNEFDWWISNQWETFNSHNQYRDVGKMHRALKGTNLKEMFIVRYADDFKIFTRTAKQAEKIFKAVKLYLKERLYLDISSEKSKITNLRKKSSDFLGFEIKAVKKKNKYVANSYVSKNRRNKIRQSLKKQIQAIQKGPKGPQTWKYNLMVMGIQNYFQYATHVNISMNKINHSLITSFHNRLREFSVYDYPYKANGLYKKRYGVKRKTYKIEGHYLFPIGKISTRYSRNFNPTISNYTNEGRKIKHKNLESLIRVEIQKMMTTRKDDYKFYTLEYLDNRLSKYSMQKGNCSITGNFLFSNEAHCHHIIPRFLGGSDEFMNLTIISRDVHKLVHAVQKEPIMKYTEKLNLDGKQLSKLNKLREKCNLQPI